MWHVTFAWLNSRSIGYIATKLWPFKCSQHANVAEKMANTFRIAGETFKIAQKSCLAGCWSVLKRGVTSYYRERLEIGNEMLSRYISEFIWYMYVLDCILSNTKFSLILLLKRLRILERRIWNIVQRGCSYKK